MFQDLMSLMAGFLTAYLIIRAVRSFFRTAGVGVLLLVGVWDVQGQGAYVTWVNNGTYAARPYVSLGAPPKSAQQIGFSPLSPGTSRTDRVDQNTVGTYYWDWSTNNGVSMLGLGTGSYYWNGSATATNVSVIGGTKNNEVKCFGPWSNTNSCPVMIELGVVTNGVVVYNRSSNSLLPGDVMPYMCLTNAAGIGADGNGIPFSIVVTRSPCPEDPCWDIRPSCNPPVENGDSGTLPDPGNPVPGNPEPPKVDPRNPPTNSVPPMPTNITGDNVLHNDLQQLTRMVAKEVKQDLQTPLLQSMEANLRTNRTGASNVSDDLTHRGLTNLLSLATNDYGLLGQIATNTANTVIAVNSNLVSIGQALFGNGSNIIGSQTMIVSNTSQADGVTVSNVTIGGWAGLMAGASNQWGSNWANGIGSVTNGVVAWNSSVTEPGGDPTAVTIGGPLVSATLSFSLLHTGGVVRDKFLAAAPWVKTWLAWLITLGLWWACIERMDEHLKAVQIAGILVQKPSGGVVPAGALLARVGIGSLLVGGITTVIAILPTAVTAWLNTKGVDNPHGPTFTGLADSIPLIGFSQGVAVASDYYILLGNWIPFSTLFTAMASWVIFYFFCGWLAGFVFLGLRVAGLLAPVFVFCVWQVHGDQVRFENLAGSSVQASNGAEVVSVPPGVVEGLVLSPGDWSCGTNGFTILGSGSYQVVRAVGQTNGVVFLAVSQGYSTLDWFWTGFNLGFIVFGTAWAVSSARQGFLLRLE